MVVVISVVIVVVSMTIGVVVSTSLFVLMMVVFGKIGGGTVIVLDTSGTVPKETEIGGGTIFVTDIGVGTVNSVTETGGAGAVPVWTEIGGTKISVEDTGVGQPCLHEVTMMVDVVRKVVLEVTDPET